MDLQKIFRGGFIVLATATLFTGCGGGGGDSAPAADNTAPVANAQSLTTVEDTNKTITLTGNDADGDSLTYTITADPAHGTLTYAIATAPARGTLSGTAPNLTYTPDTGYNGSDSFAFMVNDGTTDSAAATVSIAVTAAAVNTAPVADAQDVTTDEDTAAVITLSGSDADGDALTYAITTGPANGQLSGTPPNVTYTPNPDFSGSDSFAFTINDSTVDSTPATVSIAVTNVNVIPVANAQSVATDENMAKAITLMGTDADGDNMTYKISTPPANGQLSGTPPNVTYTPNPDFSGSDSFAFTINDGMADSTPATVSITVTDPALNTAPVANAQSLTTVEDTNKAITLSGSDANGDSLTYYITTTPTRGLLSGTPPNVTYIPVSNDNGSDSFTFTVGDGEANSTAATVSITISAVNDAPKATNGSLYRYGSVATSGTLKGTDEDDGDSLTFSIATNPTSGLLTLDDSATGAYTYTPSVAGNDSFTFTVNDGTVESAPATITISHIPVPDAPAVTAVGGNFRVKLSWDAVADAVSYNVYWSLASGAGKMGSKIADVSSPFYQDGLIYGASYYYVVTAVNAEGESMPSAEVTATPANLAIADLTFADANLSACVTTEATDANVTNVAKLNYLDCSNRSISDISGIDQLTSLSWLYLDRNNISDISQLAALTNLTELFLYTNNISDISPLAALSILDSLDLDDNTISDVSPLSAVSSLTYMILDNNTITDVSPLAALTNLDELFLWNNTIGGLDVGNVDDLVTLQSATAIDLSDNPNISCSELQTLSDALPGVLENKVLGTLTCTP